MKRLLLSLFALVFLLSLISFPVINAQTISANTGCCFDSANGLCTPNSESGGCSSELGGVFYSGQACASVSKCMPKCCVLGLTAGMMTEKECQKRTLEAGFAAMDLREITAEECALLVDTQETGACVIGEDYEPLCTVTAQGLCSGKFLADKTCLDIPGPCSKESQKTACYKGDVYSLDVCGNIAKKKEDCDYASGTMCKQTGAASECKSVDCTEPYDWMEGAEVRKNGERWCIGPLTEAYRAADTESALSTVTYNADAGGDLVISWPEVYRQETISALQASNPGGDYSNFNPSLMYYTDSNNPNSATTRVPAVPSSADFTVQYGSFTVTIPAQSTSGSFDATEVMNVDGSRFRGYKLNIPPSAKIPAGSDFYSAYCLEGEIKIEACNPTGGLMNYCWGGQLESPEALGGGAENSDSEGVNGDAVKDVGVTGNAVGITGKDVGVNIPVTTTPSRIISSSALELAEASPPERTGGKCIRNKGYECSSIENSETCNADPACYWLEGAWNVKYRILDYWGHESCGGSRCVFPVGGSYKEDFENINREADGAKVFTGVEQCMPKIPAGGEFIAAEKTGAATASSCDYGKFETDKIYYSEASASNWLDLCVMGDEDKNNVEGDLRTETEKIKCNALTWPDETPFNGMPINPNFWALLEEKTKALGDCAGDKNGDGKEGTENVPVKPASFTSVAYPAGDFWVSSNKFERDSPAWLPPKEGRCDTCGVPPICSEYSCRAIGKNCGFRTIEVVAAAGGSATVCYDLGDKSPPVVTSYSTNPESPIPPWSPVQINITTDEIALCKFSLNKNTAYESMSTQFSGIWTKEHSVILNAPGIVPQGVLNAASASSNASTASISAESTASGASASAAASSTSTSGSEFPLLTTDGEYEMYVKCEDVAGNFNLAPAALISFTVSPYPDMSDPYILEFIPPSGSKIKFNTTTKEIKFKIDAPAECKWNFSDADFNLMPNKFACDSSVSLQRMINGYFCSGNVTNVTLNFDEQTTYYIRCKDQPWLEGKEGDIYKRNVNEIGREYKLGPSEKLEIVEASPNGTIKVGKNNPFVEIFAATSGGSDYGNAECLWSLGNSSSNARSPFVRFFSTGRSFHSQRITSPYAGENIVFAICNDSAENLAKVNFSFNMEIDESSPEITRIFEQSGRLKIKTAEDSRCYASFSKILGCAFDILDLNNSVLMTAGELKKEHSAEWKYGRNYYIKCFDKFNNTNIDCGIIAKTR